MRSVPLIINEHVVPTASVDSLGAVLLPDWCVSTVRAPHVLFIQFPIDLHPPPPRAPSIPRVSRLHFRHGFPTSTRCARLKSGQPRCPHRFSLDLRPQHSAHPTGKSDPVTDPTIKTADAVVS